VIFSSRWFEAWWSRGLGFLFRTSNETRTGTLHIGFLFVALSIRVPLPWRDLRQESRKWGWQIQHRMLWWSWGESDSGWNSKDSWMRRFTIDPKRLILGRQTCETVKGEQTKSVVPMPEGSYPCVLTQETRTWVYPRFPFLTRSRKSWDIQIDGGIPFRGKGENSWDCGDDGLWGTSGGSPENAIANAVEAVLRSRGRHGETAETRGRVVYARPTSEAI